MSALRLVALVLAAVLAVAAPAVYAVGEDEAIPLAIAAVAFFAGVVVVVTSPDWDVLQDDVRALRRAAEARPRPAVNHPEDKHRSWVVLAAGIAIGLALRRRRRRAPSP
jgi:hypothetical protein